MLRVQVLSPAQIKEVHMANITLRTRKVPVIPVTTDQKKRAYKFSKDSVRGGQSGTNFHSHAVRTYWNVVTNTLQGKIPEIVIGDLFNIPVDMETGKKSHAGQSATSDDGYDFILNDKTGLASLYPWLLNNAPKGKFKPGKIENEADYIVQDKIKKKWLAGGGGLDPNQLYYIFFEIDVFRVGSVLPIGELEDITFTLKSYLMSQNIMLVKLLEMECRQRELEHYINEIVGLTIEKRPIEEVIKKEYPELFGTKPKELSSLKKIGEEWKGIAKEFRGFFAPAAKMQISPERRGFFVKPGRYEKDFKERLSKQYLTPIGGKFATVTGLLKEKIGVG